MFSRLALAVAAFAAAAGTASAAVRFHLPMDIAGNTVTETLTGQTYRLEDRNLPMQIVGGEGNAWRTDGYTSHLTGHMPEITDGNTLTARVLLAVDTYHIISHDNPDGNNRRVEIVGCLDDAARTGYGFYMGRTGQYSFRVYVGGSLVSVEAPDRVPLWEWTELTGTVDGTEVRLYRNGTLVSSATASGSGVRVGPAPLRIGRGNGGETLGGADLSTFNGAFDEISVSDNVEVRNFSARYADLNIPADRYAADRMRARYHGQPGMNWTNETHGLYYNDADGLWHAFFQKTGSAPVMSHQHWGHITSPDLITWRDDKPVLHPSEPYDLKGCWSGCVFTDEELTGGKPAILYTGVDYATPYAALATCDDTEHLRHWTKDPSNPVRLAGNYRDTYFFRDGNDACFIIGGDDAVKLYRHKDGSWVADGDFYRCQEGVDRGFTEMPNVTYIPFSENPAHGQWLMTTSPLASSYGTVCLYRTGDISDGRFTGYSAAAKVDLLGRDGFGLLSPSVGRTPDGRIVAMGIVPDKLPTHYNISHGYAHLYSLPREWTLDADGTLMQRPYSGIEAYRNADESMQFHRSGATLDGALTVNPVRGREAEVCAVFTVGENPFGFNFYKDENGRTAKVTYNPATHEVSVDFGNIARYDQDGGNPSRFSSVLDKAPVRGEQMKLHLFIDHSIIDLFVNDRYAASVRVFPTDDNADLIEVFAEGSTFVDSIDAWIIGDGDSSPEPVTPFEPEIPESTGRVAMLVGYDSPAELAANHQEKEAVDFFSRRFPDGQVLYGTDCLGLNVSDFDCVWINVDRIGIGKGCDNLPSPFNTTDFASKLADYVADGGNLYLSKFAVQLAQAIGRTDAGIGVFDDGNGGAGVDVWQTNVRSNGVDFSDHAIYYGIDKKAVDYGIVVDLLGNQQGLHREDHNCMWNMNDFGGHDRFCDDNNARVLGTWGHPGGQSYAGIVEFMPVTGLSPKSISSDRVKSRRGTVIANGLAAYEWAPRTGVNLYHGNIEKLTANIMGYLSPKASVSTDLSAVSGQKRIEVRRIGSGLEYRSDMPVDRIEVFRPDGRMVIAADPGNIFGQLYVSESGPVIVRVISNNQPECFKLIL